MADKSVLKAWMVYALSKMKPQLAADLPTWLAASPSAEAVAVTKSCLNCAIVLWRSSAAAVAGGKLGVVGMQRGGEGAGQGGAGCGSAGGGCMQVREAMCRGQRQ